MKKLLIILICVILTICFWDYIFIKIPLNLEQFILYSLPDYEDKETHYSSGFQDYTDYCKYFYKDDSITKKIKNHKLFTEINRENIKLVNRIFEDHKGWGKSHFDEDYDFSMECINEGDCFSLYIPEKYIEERHYLWNYDMFFFDKESLTLYFIHNNI